MQTQVQTQASVNTTNATAASNDTPATIAVGLNDTVQAAPATNTATTVMSTYKRIEQLAIDREVWEQGALRTSNEQLYALLAKCYALYGEMCSGSAIAKAMRAELEDFIGKKAYRFLESTHTLTKIVKCVFGVDRRRVSTYSLVLREALTQKLTADQVAAFIASNGGVEEIRRSKSATAKTPKQKAELGREAVCSNQLAVISSDKIAESIDLANVGSDLIAIVTQQADGSLIVRKLISSKSVLNAALACAYSASKAVVQTDIKNNEAANDDKVRDDQIQKTAAM